MNLPSWSRRRKQPHRLRACAILAETPGPDWPSEVPLFLAQFHGGIVRLIVQPRCAPLCDASLARLRDDLVKRRGGGLDWSRAGNVAHRPETHAQFLDALTIARRRYFRHRYQGGASSHDCATVREIDLGQLNVL